MSGLSASWMVSRLASPLHSKAWLRLWGPTERRKLEGQETSRVSERGLETLLLIDWKLDQMHFLPSACWPKTPCCSQQPLQLHFDCWTHIRLPANHEVNLLTSFQNYAGKWVMPEARRVMAKGKVFYQGLFPFWKRGSDWFPMLNLNNYQWTFELNLWTLQLCLLTTILLTKKTTVSSTPKSPTLIWDIRTNYVSI